MRGNLKGMFFLCLVSTLYLVQGVLIIFDPALFYWGVAEVFFALALCGITALYVRKLREYNAANEADGDTEQDWLSLTESVGFERQISLGTQT